MFFFFFQVLTNSGAVPPLVVLLDSPNEEVRPRLNISVDDILAP